MNVNRNSKGELTFGQKTKMTWLHLEKDLTNYVRGSPQRYVYKQPNQFHAFDWEIITYCRQKAPTAIWVGTEHPAGGKIKVITKNDVPTKKVSTKRNGTKVTVMDGTIITREVIIPTEAVLAQDLLAQMRHTRQRTEGQMQKNGQGLSQWENPQWVKDYVANQVQHIKDAQDNLQAQLDSQIKQEEDCQNEWDTIVKANVKTPKGENPPPNCNVWLSKWFQSVEAPVPQ
jgi:hypothetical protein